VCDMPNTSPPVTSAERFKSKLELVDESSYVDFALWAGGTDIDEICKMASLGAIGLKIYMNRPHRSDDPYATTDPIPYLQRPEWFRTIYVSSEVWQTVGWGTILYLAALTAIDENLYEAARIDGAGRLRQTWHVTLPGIRPTMVTLLILNIGTFMAVVFEKVMLLYTPLTYPTADVISTYLYRLGLLSNNFSYAAAIGLFEAVIGLTLILSANAISRRTVGASLW
jgi:ABC-type polysaccharide transport system permease subunit